MIIDGYFHGEIFLIGKKCTRQQLNQMYLQARKLTNEEKDFPDVFCRLHPFEKLPFAQDKEVDFVIDTDADRIYSPSY